MKPEEILGRFHEALRLLERVRATRRRLRGTAEWDLIVEAFVRLEQATYLLHRFREVELEHEGLDHVFMAGSVTREEHAQIAERIRHLGELIRLHGEAFYYFAWRARQALRRVDGLKFKAVGVRNVRNRMLEHPDGAGGVHVGHWIYRCPQGLVLAPLASGDDGLRIDQGLYPNAAEFIEHLLGKLSPVVASIDK